MVVDVNNESKLLNNTVLSIESSQIVINKQKENYYEIDLAVGTVVASSNQKMTIYCYPL